VLHRADRAIATTPLTILLIGVPSHIPSTVLISSGFSKEHAITKWLHPSVDQYRELIRQQNDGTLPLEPYQRISQAIFEAWLKTVCDQNHLIDPRFGWKVESVEDSKSRVTLVASDVSTGEKRTFLSRYVIGCDGASSQVRRSLEIPLDGGPT
jgi:FAD-dependent monooxygenase